MKTLLALLALMLPASAQTGTFCNANIGACPCGDSGALYQSGCPNSYSVYGASLHFYTDTWEYTETAYASYGYYTLVAYGLPPNSTVVFCQGTQVALPPAVFGDGMRCVSGSLIRIASVQAQDWGSGSWSASYPSTQVWPPIDPPLHVRGAIPPGGGFRSYQAIYRNPANFCTPATFNTSNGWAVTWIP